MKHITQNIQSIISRAIEDRIFPGCVIGVVMRKGKREVLPFGGFTYEVDAPPMKEDTVFDVASITKSIPTATLALIALEQGMIEINEPVARWIPELRSRYKEQFLVKHLLTHTLDFTVQLSSCKDLSGQEILETIFSAEVHNPPGTSFLYCNATSILCGILVERVFGIHLDKLADIYLLRPLEMDRTSFHPKDSIKDAIVPTEIDAWRGRVIQGEIHDESAWKLSRIMIPGSAGLFSCVPDLLNFLEMLLHDGDYKSNHFIDPETIQMLSTNQIAETGECTGLGWELNQARYMGTRYSNRTIGKTGFTGCVVMTDLEKGIGLVLLSNYTWPHRKAQKEQINNVRREIADIVFSI